jgi:hypothetical protein
MKVLGVAPCFDEASEYSFKWYERLRNAIKDKVELRELLRDVAFRSAFEGNVEAFQPDAIVFYNHGSDDCLCAQDGGTCVLDSDNVDKVAGKIIYTMACLSAKKLGAEAWKRGCIYVGYIEAFTFTTNAEQLFCQAANSGFTAYAEGETDWAKIKALMVEAFNKALEQAADPWTKIWLQWDRDILRIYAPGADTPETKCVFRKAAITILGPKLGWMISRKHAISLLLLGAGAGVYLHDRIAEWTVLGQGQRLHGLDVGFALAVTAYVILTFDFVKWLRKKA